MKRLIGCLILAGLFFACSIHETARYNKQVPHSELEWTSGEEVQLSGTIWPSRAYTKYYIDTDDGKSAHLKSDLIDKLEAGTRLYLTGTVEYIDTFGTAGASMVQHSQTYFFVKVTDYEILVEKVENE